MESVLPTTPFGRRPLALAHIASQVAAKHRSRQATAHKWTVFRALCAAKLRLGLTERSLAVLDALLTFHPETVLTGDDLIVFPSNDQLALRAHGMAPSTMRRHLALLVDAGIIIRRDSPNGKRYARKSAGGSLSHAFESISPRSSPAPPSSRPSRKKCEPMSARFSTPANGSPSPDATSSRSSPPASMRASQSQRRSRGLRHGQGSMLSIEPSPTESHAPSPWRKSSRLLRN